MEMVEFLLSNEARLPGIKSLLKGETPDDFRSRRNYLAIALLILSRTKGETRRKQYEAAFCAHLTQRLQWLAAGEDPTQRPN